MFLFVAVSVGQHWRTVCLILIYSIFISYYLKKINEAVVFSLWNTCGGEGIIKQSSQHTHTKKKKKNRKMTVEFIKWWDISIGKKITKLKARVRAERELEIANCVFLISFRFYVLIDCLSFQRCESIICIQDLKGSQLKEPTSSRYYTFINFYIYLCI